MYFKVTVGEDGFETAELRTRLTVLAEIDVPADLTHSLDGRYYISPGDVIKIPESVRVVRIGPDVWRRRFWLLAYGVGATLAAAGTAAILRGVL